MRPVRLILAATLLGATLLPASAQQPQQPQQNPAASQQAPANAAAMHQRLAQFRHVPLTEEKAKAAIEVFLKLKATYPPETFKAKTPGPMGATEAMKRSEKAEAILKMVKDKGFDSIDEWAQTFASVGMALAHVRQGDDNAEKKLQELEASPMPEEMKAQIRALLKAVIPPKENAEVAKQLLADEQTKKMIDEVEKPR